MRNETTTMSAEGIARWTKAAAGETTYSKGDLAQYNGETMTYPATRSLSEKIFYGVVIMDGHEIGAIKWIVAPPKSVLAAMKGGAS